MLSHEKWVRQRRARESDADVSLRTGVLQDAIPVPAAVV
jgi:hypothetical protein